MSRTLASSNMLTIMLILTLFRLNGETKMISTIASSIFTPIWRPQDGDLKLQMLVFLSSGYSSLISRLSSNVTVKTHLSMCSRQMCKFTQRFYLRKLQLCLNKTRQHFLGSCLHWGLQCRLWFIINADTVYSLQFMLFNLKNIF